MPSAASSTALTVVIGMSDYAPTTEQVREGYVDTGWAADGSLGEPRDPEVFDRWLAAHDAQVRADERERIATKFDRLHESEADPWYWSEAAQITRDGGGEE